ncbi:MAG: M1 family metallopeptidase [Candidatus Pacebacteria bacterium]|nr:M1 family metallopeptidase [Candidatus Paceibacterota bacterium]
MQSHTHKAKQLRQKGIRLTDTVVPIHYKLSLAPDLDAHTFAGDETITIEIKKTTKNITLHSIDLDIESVHVVVGKNTQFAQKISYNNKKESATFSFIKSIPKGKARLVLSFRGLLSDSLRGFYKSHYIHKGEEKILATTQFEATDARRAFPCFDEPAQKAVFDVSLIVPFGKTAISNTLPIATREHSPGFQRIDFASTPKMSTYLLAFMIGHFEYIERKTNSGVKVRIFTTPGKKGQAKFALDVSVRCLEFYESYFGIKYPLNTLDTIAIPDFESGAMENWGAITYRESCILVDDEHTSLNTKQWTAIVICHELAHQWFGNLVTMEWWTDLWLNEGFASYIEYLAADHLFPQWKLWEQFVAIDHSIALRLDSLATTHPIEVDVHHPSDITEIFDEISYQKGAATIRMLAEYLGAVDFRKGLSYYLKKHSYKNTSTVHLWEAFEKVSKKPVKKMMHRWTRNSGHPLVTVEEKNGKLIVSQSRFFRSPLSEKKSRDKTVWPIPLSMFGGDESTYMKLLFNKKTMRFDRGDHPWIKINMNEEGVYRVRYSAKLLMELRRPIEDKVLTPEDRLGIVRDLFALAESGKFSTKDTLEFLTAYKNEDSYIVWSEIVTGLSRVRNLYFHEIWMQGFESFVRELLGSMIEKVGLSSRPNEPHSETLLRSLILSSAAHYGVKKVINHAKKAFNTRHVHPDVRGFVYSTYARHGGAREHAKLTKLYVAETLHEEKNRLGGALGHFRDKNLLAKTLEFSLSSVVRPQDTPSMIASVWSNHDGRELAWQFVKKNWSILLKRYGVGGHTLGRILKPAGLFSEEKYARDFEKFMNTHPHPGADRTITQILEGIRANTLWKKTDKLAVKNFCRRYL